VYDVADRAELDEILAKDPYFTTGEPVATVATARQWDILPFE
jgi:hypothetical protein